MNSISYLFMNCIEFIYQIACIDFQQEDTMKKKEKPYILISVLYFNLSVFRNKRLCLLLCKI